MKLSSCFYFEYEPMTLLKLTAVLPCSSCPVAVSACFCWGWSKKLCNAVGKFLKCMVRAHCTVA